MEKMELVHVHGLLVETQRFLENSGMHVENERYESVSVGPSGIHKVKSQQKEAVFALAEDIAKRTSSRGNEEIYI